MAVNNHREFDRELHSLLSKTSCVAIILVLSQAEFQAACEDLTGYHESCMFLEEFD